MLTGLLAVVFWSTASTAFKLGLQSQTPLQLVTLATLASALILGGALALRRPPATRTAPGWRRLLAEATTLGLINPLLFYPTLLSGYDRLPAQIAQPLNYTWAIVLALLAVPLLRQRLARRAVLGIAISYSGALLLIAGATASPLGTPDPLGVALIFASTLLWALYWIMNTRTRSDPLILLATSFAMAGIMLSIALSLLGAWPPLTRETVGYALWIGALEMGLTFVLWQRALRLTAQVGRIGQLIFLAPFLSLVPIALVLGEAIQPSSLLGLTIIVTGLVVTGQPTSPAAGNSTAGGADGT